MTLDATWPIDLRNALIVVGLICVFLGLVLRGRGISNKGIAVALLVVGFFMILAAPAGRLANWW